MKYFVLFILFSGLSFCENIVELNGVVDGNMLEKFFKDLNKYSSKVVIKIDSPGGMVSSMKDIINILENNKHKISHCIAYRAYSAAFMIFEHCEKRYITPKSSLMWHQYKLSFDWMDILPAYKFTKQAIDMFKEDMYFLSKRMKYPLHDLYKAVERDWWLTPYQAIKLGAADKIIGWGS